MVNGALQDMTAEKGFTYIWMLFAVALSGIVLAGAGQLWQTEARREKEVELLFAGEQFRQAIGSYYENSPGMPKRFPDSLEKLLADDRFPIVKRHLRKIFLDPMTGKAEWGLIRKPGIGIVGVHSLSVQKPFKRANFHERYATFADAMSYQGWEFVYLPGEAGSSSSQPDFQSQPQPQINPQSQPRPRLESEPLPGPERLPPREQESSPFPVSPGPSTAVDPTIRFS
ncbi:MAG: type II secretion system protein [Nitrosospira sp.]